MPRFVFLRHQMPPGAARASHWDFMLEQNGELRTWALGDVPTVDADVSALELAVHRMAYLQYEGPISGDRGTVTRWDEGEFTVVRESADSLQLTLTGKRLQGSVRLDRNMTDPVYWTFRLVSG